MDWQALNISLSLAALSALILTPVGVIAARHLAWKQVRGRSVTQALIALPLVLPPTVLGLFLLLAFSDYLPSGPLFAKLAGEPLVFSFEGILAASLIFNIPFIVQPMQRGFETIPRSLREAAWWQRPVRLADLLEGGTALGVARGGRRHRPDHGAHHGRVRRRPDGGRQFGGGDAHPFHRHLRSDAGPGHQGGRRHVRPVGHVVIRRHDSDLHADRQAGAPKCPLTRCAFGWSRPAPSLWTPPWSAARMKSW